MQTTARVLVLLVLCTMGCTRHTARGISPQQPDQVLFDKATSAIEQQRFSVANLTLQTLLNTYPDSQYADRAKLLLREPQISRCGEGFSTTPALCDPGRYSR